MDQMKILGDRGMFGYGGIYILGENGTRLAGEKRAPKLEAMNFVSQPNCLSESINFVTVNP